MLALHLKHPLLQPVFIEFSKNGIADFKQKAQILAQLHVESGGFVTESNGNSKEENLNYSAKRLLEVFPTHFDGLKDASFIAQKGASAIANRVYSNRMGNGNEASGDGWKYRGRGLIQITGKSNYTSLSKHFNYDFINDPDAISKPEWSLKSAFWFLTVFKKSFLESARRGDCLACTKLINGGIHKLDDRTDLYYQYYALLSKK